jgi:hypothetical protein
MEGRTIAIEYRCADGRTERFAEIAAELVRLKVDVIVTAGGAVPATKQATSVIPIVLRSKGTRMHFTSLATRLQTPIGLASTPYHWARGFRRCTSPRSMSKWEV